MNRSIPLAHQNRRKRVVSHDELKTHQAGKELTLGKAASVMGTAEFSQES